MSDTTGHGQRAGGTDPTGMHSCYKLLSHTIHLYEKLWFYSPTRLVFRIRTSFWAYGINFIYEYCTRSIKSCLQRQWIYYKRILKTKINVLRIILVWLFHMGSRQKEMIMKKVVSPIGSLPPKAKTQWSQSFKPNVYHSVRNLYLVIRCASFDYMSHITFESEHRVPFHWLNIS